MSCRRRLAGSAVVSLCWLIGCAQEPPPPLSALETGEGLILAGNWQAAADTLHAAASAGEDPVGVGLRLAQIRMSTGRVDVARSQLDALPAAAEAHPLYDILRAWLVAADGQTLRSREAARAVLADHPESLEARELLARLALQASAAIDLVEARRLCIEILERVPEHYMAGRMQVQAALRSGDYDEAIRLARRQTRTYPDDGDLWKLMGTAALWKRDMSTATEALRRSVELNSDAYAGRLEALWLLRLAYEGSGGYPSDIEPEYRFDPRAAPGAMVPVPRFTDVGETLGIAKVDRGRGSTWLDFDGDGDWDLFSVGIHVEHRLYRNDGGRQGLDYVATPFADVTVATGMADPRGGWATSAADCDDDGDPDIFVTRDAWEGVAPNSLYRNDGGAGFTDVAEAAGIAGPEASFMATWGDFDVDGHLDIYVTNGAIGNGEANSLYRHDGGTELHFTNVATTAGVADTLKTIGTAAGDYDADGWPDIYSVNIGGPNRLFRNVTGEHGRLELLDVANAAGVGFPVEGAYVTFFLDYDNDGALDLFVATMSAFSDVLHSAVEGRAVEPNRPFLYQNQGDGTFADVAVPAGLARSFGTMGAGVGDVDNDGTPDLYLGNGGPEMSRLEQNVMFMQRGDGTFADITEAAGVGNIGKGHGATFADYDADGDLDLYAGLGGHYNADVWPNALYRNDGPTGRSLSVQALVGARDAVGARIAVQVDGHSVHGHIASGYGFGSANAPPVVFGLGASGEARGLEVMWPGGQRQVWTGIPATGRVRVRRGVDHLEDLGSTEP